jgi:protein-tyrosine phosphatase
MAEAICWEQISRRGLADLFEVDSAGTAAYHEGELADRRTRVLLSEYGIHYDGCARAVRAADFGTFDHILAMDASNLKNLKRVCPQEHRHKLSLALEPIGGGDVPDPYYGGPDGFTLNYRQLSEAIEVWLSRLV